MTAAITGSLSRVRVLTKGLLWVISPRVGTSCVMQQAPALGSKGGTLYAALAYKARQLVGRVVLWQATKKCQCGEPRPTLSFIKKGRNVDGAEPGRACRSQTGVHRVKRKVEGSREALPA